MKLSLCLSARSKELISAINNTNNSHNGINERGSKEKRKGIKGRKQEKANFTTTEQDRLNASYILTRMLLLVYPSQIKTCLEQDKNQVT
jgi:hypothetical protein